MIVEQQLRRCSEIERRTHELTETCELDIWCNSAGFGDLGARVWVVLETLIEILFRSLQKSCHYYTVVFCACDGVWCESS